MLIIADDFSDLAWPTYVHDCQSTYGEPFRALSDWSEYGKISIPWVRQQTVKLYLDVITGWDQFFFSDGDIVFDCHIPEDTVPYNYVEIDHNEQELAQPKYVSYMLELPFKNIMVNGRPVITSNAAFRDIRSSWLSRLRSYVFDVKQDTLLNIHKDIKDYRGVSEWELLEFFKINVMGLTPVLSTYYCQMLGESAQINDAKFLTCWCSDRAFGPSWWNSHGIATDDIWDLLPSGK